MSADVERITTGVTVVHELWAGLVSIGIALWLLDRLLGVAVAASAGLVICKSSILFSSVRVDCLQEQLPCFVARLWPFCSETSSRIGLRQ